MKVFITGASGFLGQVVLKRLISEKHDVVALSRSVSSDAIIIAAGAKPIRGSLDNLASLQTDLESTDAVIHCAAPVEFWGTWEKYEKGIISATKQLADLSAKCGVKRFVHISSESVLQDKDSLLDIDENYNYPKEPNSYYGKAKKITEEFLINSNYKMEIVIIRPSFIWGSGSNAFKEIASKVQSGHFVWIDQGEANFEAVHVENIAEAIILSLTKGKNKEIYFVTDDESATVKEFFSKVFESLKLPHPSKSIPTFIARPLAFVVENVWKWMHIPSTPPLTRFELSFVNMSRSYNITKAKEELGYKPVITREKAFSTLTLNSSQS